MAKRKSRLTSDETVAEFEQVNRDKRGLTEPEHVIRLREEELVPHKELRQAGEVQIRTQIEEFPGHLDVEALREEVQVEHVPVNQVVQERQAPWEENGALIVPVYEEKLVVTKQLILREQLRVRRVASRETKHFEDTLRRERALVEDLNNTGLVRDQGSIAANASERPAVDTRAQAALRPAENEPLQDEGFIDKLVKNVLG